MNSSYSGRAGTSQYDISIRDVFPRWPKASPLGLPSPGLRLQTLGTVSFIGRASDPHRSTLTIPIRIECLRLTPYEGSLQSARPPCLAAKLYAPPSNVGPSPNSKPGLRERGGFVRLGPKDDEGVPMYAEGGRREKPAKTPHYRKPGGVPNGTRTRLFRGGSAMESST